MSETRMMKCDGFGCRNTIERAEFKIPAGWMHIEAWYHPEDSESEYSGCAGMDLCPECVRKYRYMDDLADRCVEDYDRNVRREDRRPFLRFPPSNAAYAAAGPAYPYRSIPGAITSSRCCATTAGTSGCSGTGAMWASARTAATSRSVWTMIEDILEIMSDGQWRTCHDIARELREMDPDKYRTACHQTVANKVWKLHAKQGYEIVKHPDDRGPRARRYRLVRRCPVK